MILFDDVESQKMTAGYGTWRYLPEFSIVALIGWDDFILRSQSGGLFRVPTLPLSKEYLSEYVSIPQPSNLIPDEKFVDKIKWYIKPIVFGGASEAEENIEWVNLQTHQELVRWWNQKYHAL
ncbi:MAG: hypothetical protein AAF512_14135 [Pseudomonadota bacterium]